jgi:acyl-ACP thioesterase
MAKNREDFNSDNYGFLHSLSSAFAIAKRDAGNTAEHLAKNARRMLVRLRRVSEKAKAMLRNERGKKSPAAAHDEIDKIKLETEKYIQKKKLETSKTGKNGLLRPVSLMNELQAIADIHATLLGAGRSFCLENNITWVVTHYAVEILEMPNDKEELSFATWPSYHEALRAVRDFEVSGADGRPMIRATSQWIMIDLTTRRPVKLADFLPSWNCIPERALNIPFDKFAEPISEQNVDFNVRYDDIDVNQHVNNAVYTTWATESLGYDFLNSHKLKGFKINFKKEIPAGTPKVSVAVQIDGDTTHHVIKSNDAVNAVVACEWD